MNTTAKHIRYDALDGIRVFSAIGIVIMHVLANGKYHLQGFLFERLIPSFANLVYLFMIISAFGMCCGYHDKILQNKVALEDFYKKRFLKILPFFGLLSLLEVVISPSWEALMEMFANLTLCFGFLPNAGNISVIGVGWFLGVIFVFYMIFPFYCCLLRTKRRAWIVLALVYLFQVVCADYFGIERTNILYDAVYLILGGVIYLYRSSITAFSERHRIAAAALVTLFVVLYYVVDVSTLTTMGLYGSILVYAMGVHHKGILLNRCTKFLSAISMEIYLCHMVCFRIVERLGLTRCFANDITSFALTTVLTLAGTVVFAIVAQRGIEIIGNLIRKVHAGHAKV